MNFHSLAFEPEFGVKRGPVSGGALKPMSMYFDYGQTATQPASPQYRSTMPPLGTNNPYGMVRDNAFMTEYRDVKLTKGEAYNWNMFSFMDSSQHYKPFEVSPRLIREYRHQ